MSLLFSATSIALAAVAAAAGGPPTCSAGKILGCYTDGAAHRILPHVARFSTDKTAPMDHATCAALCCQAGYGVDAVAGVEYGSQCFCGKASVIPGMVKAKDTDCNFECPSNSSEKCGGSNRILVFHPSACPCSGPPAPPPPPPMFHGCLDNVSKSLPYCDVSLSYEKRVDDIISRLSVDEQISILSPTKKPFCACHTPPVDRIGLPKYKWLTETNTDVQGASQRTVFVGPTNMAASFNRSSWWMKGDVISTELRIANNYGEGEVGLTGFGPNINVVKDPRYGRNSEVPGEDPFLTGQYAISYTHGMQQVSSGPRPHLKMLSYMKHYTAYNVEASRFTWKNNVTQFDFWDSYLPQYKAGFIEGGSSGAMCSYFAPNGVSSCGNPWLLNKLIRSEWKRPDTVIMSDCSAVNNMQKNGYAHSPEDASAKALNAGMDVYGGWGDDLWTQGYLHKAIDQKLTTTDVLAATLRRTLLQKMKVGLFDPLEDQTWTKLTKDGAASDANMQVSYEAALQGMVLLKNKGALPIAANSKVAVLGPMGSETTGLFSDYAQAEATDSIKAAITRVNGASTTTAANGVAVTGTDTKGVAAALNLAKQADTIVLVLGQTKAQEHEGMDRGDTKLPGVQEDFAQQVLKAAGTKPVVLVLCNGGIVSFDSLVSPASAIVEAFNPAHKGPQALADLLFGNANRWGKLPVTIYPVDYTKMIDIKDYSFTKPPGRGYRYYNGTALFRFGEGMSLTTFKHDCSAAGTKAGNLIFQCTVTNTGQREGDEVLQVYHTVSDAIRKAVDHPVPLRKLVEFERVSLAKGATTSLSLSVPQNRLAVTNNAGDYALYKGSHTITFSRGTDEDTSVTVQIGKDSIEKNNHEDPGLPPKDAVEYV